MFRTLTESFPDLFATFTYKYSEKKCRWMNNKGAQCMNAKKKWACQYLFVKERRTCSYLVNMLDPIQKRYSYGQYAGRIGQDHICWIQLPASNSDPFFQRRLGSYCAILAWIQSGWPGQVWAKCIWSGNHQARFWQYVTSLHPVSHF